MIVYSYDIYLTLPSDYHSITYNVVLFITELRCALPPTYVPYDAVDLIDLRWLQ